MTAAQYFSPAGLEFIFKQLNIGDTPATPSYLVGLFTGSLSQVIGDGLSSHELTGAGYSRLSTTFGTPTQSYPVGSIETTLAANANSGDWFISVIGNPALEIGMVVQLAGEDLLTITGLPDGAAGASMRIVLSGPLSTSHTTTNAVAIGDAVAGVKSVGSAVLFSALATWPAVGGYFVVADTFADDPNFFVYASEFADTTTPILGPNDTLQVTPTWLLSS